MRVTWSTAAHRDIHRLAEYLSERSPSGAARMVRAIYARTDRMGREPLLGRIGRQEGARERVVPGTPYVIVCRLREDSLQIVRILHGAQQWPAGDAPV